MFFPCCFRSTLTPAAVSLFLRTPSIITQVLMSWKCWSFEFNWRITHGSFKKLLREGLPIFSKPTYCFPSTLTSTTVFLLLMMLSMVTQVQACDADEFSRKMGNFSWTFQEIAEGGPRLKLLNLILFALSMLLSIDLVLNLLTPRYWILNWIKFWGWLLTLWPPPLARCPSGRFRKPLNEWIFEAVEVSSNCWVWWVTSSWVDQIAVEMQLHRARSFWEC